MNEEIKNCILKAYEDTKEYISNLDENKITNIENFELSFDEIEAVAAYYNREYDASLPSSLREIKIIHRPAYSVIKTLMHLHYISIDNEKMEKIYDSGNSLPSGLRYANEIFCWNVMFYLYEFNLKLNSQLPVSKQDIKEWPPYCELHFEKTKKSVTLTFFLSRNRLSDITPRYIESIFELLTQMHINISADLAGKLLNRSGFITYLKYWGQKTATIGLMFCDLDKFKQVNDDNSHDVGDIILRKVTDVLVAICEKHDGIPARVGGEEFRLAFNYTDTNVDVTSELKQISDELKQELQKIERPGWKKEFVDKGEYKEFMTMSVAGGIVPMPNEFNHENIRKWFDQLDEVVQSIKDSGRDGYKFVDLS
jgi:diguanylate cyclase (GGDEF)-like protein